ncbi:DUF6350 family protein [Kitasatospora sp. NPDC057965]|uniref:cell division protein PerM n=1 Tax=Kitasatospora sp. NPDC057965 TaxID=3346291 RepID=UPI0036DE60B9
MTQLTGRPILGAPGELGARPVLSALLAGVRTALIGLCAVTVPVLGLWVVTPYADGGADGTLRLVAAVWLLGHGAPVLRGAAEAPLSVTPLLLGLLAVGQLVRVAGRVTARGAGRPGRGGASAVWAGYTAVACGVVAQCAGEGEFRARVLPDLVVVALVAGAAVAVGARPRGVVPLVTGVLERWLARLPETVRPTGGAVAVRAAALAAGGGLLAAGGLVVAGAAVAALLGAVSTSGSSEVLAGGPAAVAGVLLVSLVLLPNAVLWGAAYALGPGFAAGEGTVVSPVRTVLGPVPDFPLFALFPEPGAGGWRLVVCVLPALAGVAPGLLLGRAAAVGGGRTGGRAQARIDARIAGRPGGRPGARGPWSVPATAVAALVAGLLVGSAAAGLGGLSGGALAAGRMAWLGPVPWWTGLAAAAWVATVAAPTAVLARARVLRAAGGRAPLLPGALTVAARRSALLLRARVHATVTRLSDIRSSDPDPRVSDADADTGAADPGAADPAP